MPTTRLRYTVEQQAWTIDPANPSAAAGEDVRKRPAAAARSWRRGGGRRRWRRVAGAAATAGRRRRVRTGAGPIALRDVPRPLPRGAGAHGVREAARGSVQGRDVRLDGVSARRSGVPRAESRDPSRAADRPAGAAGRRRRSRACSSIRTCGPTGVVWHPSGAARRVPRRHDWRDELKYERPDIWIGQRRRQAHAADRRRLRARRSRVLAGRQVPVVRADVRHRHDHRQEAEPRRAARSVRRARSTAAAQPINLTAKWDLEPGRRRWSPDSRFVYFTAGIGGETHLFRVSVPRRRRSSRSRKASAASTASSFDRDFTNDRLHGRRATTRRATSTSRTSTAPASGG